MSEETATYEFNTPQPPIQIPVNHNIVGTCGNCGGPVISPMMWAGSGNPTRWCVCCGKHPNPVVYPAYGPILEMK